MVAIGLRSNLVGTIGWTAFFLLYSFIDTASYVRLANGPAQDRLSLAAGLSGIGQSFSFILPLPERLDTMGGYLAWFLFGFMPLIGVWAVISGTGASRGDEERGLTEQWLAQGANRWWIVGSRVLTFMPAAATAVLVPALLAEIISRAGNVDLPPQGMALMALPLVGLGATCYAVGMIAGQFMPTRRNALGVGVLIVVGLLLINGLSRTSDWLKPYRWMSPFAYVDRSNPMVPGGHFDLPATLVLYAMAIAVTALAVWTFAERDIGTSFIRARREMSAGREPSRNIMLRSPSLAALWDQRLGVTIWSVALGGYALIDLSATNSFLKFFAAQSSSTMGNQARVAFGYGRGDAVAGFFAGEWLPAFCLFVCIFAITQVARWSSDDVEGRLEMMLSAPVHRTRVIFEREVTMALLASVIIAADFVAMVISSWAQGFNLSIPKLALASAMIVPLVLAVAATGAAISVIRPRIATMTLSAILVLSYVIPLMAVPLFLPKSPPDWFVNLSVFKLYGEPLVDGINWAGLEGLIVLIAAGLAVALWSMQRREVGR